jgi:hypothetical protein
MVKATDNWRGGRRSCERSDGLTIVLGVSSWTIIPPEGSGQDPVSACPLCGRPMASPEKAKRVADVWFPIGPVRLAS